MTRQDSQQVAATNNLFADTMRYFQHLPPKRVRNAEKLDRWFEDVENIFFKRYYSFFIYCTSFFYSKHSPCFAPNLDTGSSLVPSIIPYLPL